MYLVDFVTFGGLKRIKNRFFTQMYLPIYRFWSLITLSFLYRPILYNLLDNSYGKRVAWLTLPYLLLFPIFATSRIDSYPLLEGIDKQYASQDGGYVAAQFYDDQREDDLLVIFSIPSRSIAQSHLEVFLQYSPDDNPYLAKLCSKYTITDSSPFHNDFLRGIRESIKRVDGDTSALVDTQSKADCIRQMYRVYLDDSLIHQLHPKVYIHPNNDERGVLCFIDIAALPRGMHQLRVAKTTLPPRADSVETISNTIPFWRD